MSEKSRGDLTGVSWVMPFCGGWVLLVAILFVSDTRQVVPSRVVKKGSVVSILRVLTKRGGDDEKTGGVSTEIR